MQRIATWVVLAAVGGAAGVCTAQPTPVREGDKKLPFKARHQFYSSGMFPRKGAVTAIDKDSLTLRITHEKTKEETSETFQALDLHKAGEYHEWASGAEAYRWADVKKEDTLYVNAQKDKADGTVYAIDFCISRRPGEKLPQSQDPKWDDRYKYESFLNDIDNGEDKTEEEILKLYPPQFERWGGLLRPSRLPLGYREKLTANKEKLEKEKKSELKAKPPEKK